jgi:hypothetical protein
MRHQRFFGHGWGQSPAVAVTEGWLRTRASQASHAFRSGTSLRDASGDSPRTGP